MENEALLEKNCYSSWKMRLFWKKQSFLMENVALLEKNGHSSWTMRLFWKKTVILHGK
jgi:hypothetical protein